MDGAAPLAASRLKEKGDFTRVFIRPRRFYDPLFLLLTRRNTCCHARFGMSVAKRSVSLAVKRNGIKRIIRESFWAVRHHLPAVDVVVLASAASATADRHRLRRQMDLLWQRLIAS